MTRIFYDFEFNETGSFSPLVPLSIGMIRDDEPAGLYLVNGSPGAVRSALARSWLREHVIPHLPVCGLTVSAFQWDTHHPDYRNVVSGPAAIRDAVHAFIRATSQPVQLWGDCPYYDHVLLMQLFGTMAQAPDGIPRDTGNLRQEAARLGIEDLPRMPGAREHHALDDARETRWRMHWIEARQKGWESCPCHVCQPARAESGPLR